MNNKYKNKTLLILSILFIIIVSVITISLLEVYAICSSEYTNETVEIEKNNKNTVNNEIKNDVIKQTENKSEVEDTNLAENIIVEEKAAKQTNKVQTYTTSNGEKYDIIGRLKIPSLSIEYPILANDTEQLRKISLTKYWGGNVNEEGNLCILGHNYKDSRFFGKLPNIQKNAIIQITDLNGKTLEYKVYDTAIVDPNDTSCTSQLTNGNTEITLITCYYEKGYTHATKRFVVKARTY